MRSKTKIVFIHEGKSWFLPYALHQAKSSNPEAEIVLLGEKVPYAQVTSTGFEILQGTQLEIDFRKSYVHLNTNPESFELICFVRWFYLLQYMELNKVDEVFCFDSDVLLYSSVAELFDVYDLKNADCGFLIFGQEDHYTSASAGTSFWTREALKKFCDYMVQCYGQESYLKKLKDLWERYRDGGGNGGICDMTVLYMFWQENHVRTVNLFLDRNRNIFDQNINLGVDYGAGEFEIFEGQKKVLFVNGKPNLFRLSPTKEQVMSHLLHFQGQAKGDMPVYYTGCYFKGKMAADLKAFAYRMRRSFNRK